jgi:pyruvate dehydrogenase E2 component (dihydrolipoamide acetyltransferase)
MANEIEIKVPDIGGASNVDVIEILVKEGDKISKDSSLLTLESDKASMEIPSPIDGVVSKIKVKVGDKVSEGDVIVIASAEGVESTPEPKSTSVPEPVNEPAPISAVAPSPVADQASDKPATLSVSTPVRAVSEDDASIIFAGPAVRRLAREFGVNLTLVKGSGNKSRITKEDVQAYVKTRLSESSNGSGFTMPSAPIIDFSKFGEIETKPLNKIKKLTGINVHRSWVSIPHVTQFDEADITALEDFRKLESDKLKESGIKLTILAFVCKAVSKALIQFPQFNSSLDSSGENLIYKKYCHIGIAVDTPNGLVVPVIKDVNKLTIVEIATEMTRLSQKARDKGLMPADMSGGCFTISSLGGISGTAFTPIVNGPEVAILGLSKSTIKPVYENGEFIPRLMLPLSLSYDHRVIDGAEGARFTRYLSELLSDIRRILL